MTVKPPTGGPLDVHAAIERFEADLAAIGATLDLVQTRWTDGAITATTRQGSLVSDADVDSLRSVAESLPEDHPSIEALDRVIDALRGWG